jgi:hypothetical protein
LPTQIWLLGFASSAYKTKTQCVLQLIRIRIAIAVKTQEEQGEADRLQLKQQLRRRRCFSFFEAGAVILMNILPMIELISILHGLDELFINVADNLHLEIYMAQTVLSSVLISKHLHRILLSLSIFTS